MRTTRRDPNLPHQPILRRNGSGHVFVTCNCRRVKSGTKYQYEPIATVTDRDGIKLHYNNPQGHRNLQVPFGPDWEIYKDVDVL